jgi:hypothetical protein
MSRDQEQKTVETRSTAVEMRSTAMETRSIARQLAREIRPEELEVAGGMVSRTTCSCCRPDDCGL